MKIEETPMQAIFGKAPQIRVIETLLHHPDFEFHLTELTKCSGVSRAVVFELKDKLLHYGIMEPTKRIGRAQFFKFNKSSPAGEVLNNLSFKLADVDIDLMVKGGD